MSDKSDLIIYKQCLEVLPMPVLLVGADEHILFMNTAYGEFLGMEPEKAIGRHVYEVIENSRTPLVLKTQKAEYADRHKYINVFIILYLDDFINFISKFLFSKNY